MKNINRNDIYLFFLIIALALGNIGGALSFSRILGILLFPLIVVKLQSKAYAYTYSVLFFFFFWYAYNLLSLFWTSDIVQAKKELFYYIIHFVLFIEIMVFSKKASKPLSTISMAFMIAFLITSVVGLWELITDNHLHLSKFQEDTTVNNGSGMLFHHRFASVTFGNYNSYVTFICFCMPFIVYRLFVVGKGFVSKLFPMIAILLSILFLLFNASRGGILSMLVMISIFVYYSLFSKNKRNRQVICVLVLLVMVGSFCFTDIIFESLLYRLSGTNLVEDNSRINIWHDALRVFYDSYGIGSGVGSLSRSMGEVATQTFIATHNMLLELLVQYGCVIFFIVILFLYKLLKRAFVIRDKSRKFLLLLALFPLPIYLIIDSSYLLSPSLYIFVSSLYVFANYECIRYSH